MTTLPGPSDIRSVTLALDGLDVTVTTRAGVVALYVGMPPSGMAEEPGYEVELAPGQARRIAQAIESASYDAQRAKQ